MSDDDLIRRGDVKDVILMAYHEEWDTASGALNMVMGLVLDAPSVPDLRAEVERLTRERDEARDLYTETEERRSRDLTRMDARVAELEAAFLELQRWLAKYVERRDDVMQNRDDDDQNCMYQVGQRSAALMALGKVNAALAPKEDA